MAHSNVWSNRLKKCHSSSVFHNVNNRSLFGSDVVQPFLINSSKGMLQQLVFIVSSLIKIVTVIVKVHSGFTHICIALTTLEFSTSRKE